MVFAPLCSGLLRAAMSVASLGPRSRGGAVLSVAGAGARARDDDGGRYPACSRSAMTRTTAAPTAITASRGRHATIR